MQVRGIHVRVKFVFVVVTLAAFALPIVAQEDSKKFDVPEKPGAIRKVRVEEAGETVVVKVRIAKRDLNLSTVLSLSEPVASLVTSWDQKDISINHDKNKLFVKLLSKTKGYVDVITTNGNLVRFLILPMPAPAPYDSHVSVSVNIRKNKAADKKPVRVRKASGALELIKAMRLSEVPKDATVRNGKKALLSEDEDLKVTLLYVYDTGRFRGFVLKLTNKSLERAHHVDVTRFAGKNQVLVGVREMVVPAGMSTRLYVVDWQ